MAGGAAAAAKVVRMQAPVAVAVTAVAMPVKAVGPINPILFTIGLKTVFQAAIQGMESCRSHMNLHSTS